MIAKGAMEDYYDSILVRDDPAVPSSQRVRASSSRRCTRAAWSCR
jgi:hypothetical protein